MYTFDCSGWLHITLTDGHDIAIVRLKHRDNHIPYWCIDVPSDIQDFVRAQPQLNPTQLWCEILKKYPKPAFSRKAIYQLWLDKSSLEWKRDQDELVSSRILIDEASRSQDPSKMVYQVESIQVHNEEGFIGIAFALPDLLKKWGNHIRELSLDSAWNTNGSNYEIYTLLGEVYGSGCPLGYLLLKSQSSEPNPGGKERFISDFLSHMKSKWNLKPIITLTDKDFSEINAFQNVFPDAKHQLCFWHCLRALRTRFAILRRKPRHYNVLEAKREFPEFIDEEFVPLGQAKGPNPDTHVAKKAIPRLTVRLGGVLQNIAPEPTATPRLVVKFNGRIQSLVSLPQHIFDKKNTDDDTEVLQTNEPASNVDDDEEGNDLLDD
ncbi:hypothetical protein H0H92_011798, partial [Tricholoma furcatifolium]